MARLDMHNRTLLITRNFPPLVGGMEKLNLHLFRALELRGRASLCGPAGCAEFAAEGQVLETSIRPLLLFLLKTFIKSLRLGFTERPRIAIAGSGLTAPIAWIVARLYGGRAVVYLHGLDLVAPSRLYQWLWLAFIRRCDLAVANSESTRKLAIERGLEPARLRVLNPGVEVPELDIKPVGTFREQFGLGAAPLLLAVGRLTRRKGLVEFIDKALPDIVRKRPDTTLVVIGDDALDALRSHGGSERRRIETAAQNAGMIRHVRMLGRCNDDTIELAYRASDLHIFPVLSLGGDVEGFGMVALEAAAHGLPTVAFNVGGVPDAVAHGTTGVLVESGDYPAFSNAVIGQLEQVREPTLRQLCRDFARSKSWSVFSARLNDMLDELA